MSPTTDPGARIAVALLLDRCGEDILTAYTYAEEQHADDPGASEAFVNGAIYGIVHRILRNAEAGPEKAALMYRLVCKAITEVVLEHGGSLEEYANALLEQAGAEEVSHV